MHSPRLFDSIPEAKPATPLLDRIASPADLRELDVEQLPQLAGVRDITDHSDRSNANYT